tara:strand:- start:52 stop:579 length:528 start_codon:yes stop_codon:yes gene_type:complete
MSNLLVQNIKHTNGNTAMTVNSNGLILPKIPILQVNSTNTDQSLTSGDTLVEWETVEIDTLNAWSTSNHRYTPTVAGYYLVGGSIRAKFTTNVLSYFTIKVNLNGSAQINTSLVSQFNFSSDILFSGNYPIPTGLILLNGSSDFIDVQINVDENVDIHDSSTTKSHFFAQLVHAT